MVDIRRKSLVFREVWFDEPYSEEGADIVLFYHWSQAVNSGDCTEVHSLEIDLEQPDDVIWSGFSASTRNQINRARKEGIQHEILLSPTSDAVSEFLDFNTRFMLERGLGDGAEPVWMRDYATQGALALTRAIGPDGAVLVWHSYFRNAWGVRQLQSVSLWAEAEDKDARNRIARANRYLHWTDMTGFRGTGVQRFDFGGWYSGATDEKLLKINAFKEEFGGAKTRRFHSTWPVSVKGKLFMKARHYWASEGLHVV